VQEGGVGALHPLFVPLREQPLDLLSGEAGDLALRGDPIAHQARVAAECAG
jgi:hypothetical protein